MGTSTSQDAKNYFSDMKQHMKPFKRMDGEDENMLDLAFSKKKTNERKEWLKGFQVTNPTMDFELQF